MRSHEPVSFLVDGESIAVIACMIPVAEKVGIIVDLVPITLLY
jgi:hypothetical protein